MKTTNRDNQDFESLDMDTESFRKIGHDVIDMIAEYFETIRERKVVPQSNSREVENVFKEDLPQTGQSPESILKEWSDKVIPNASHLGSPRYFAFVNGSGTMMSVFAAALAVAVNMNSGGWKAGPAAAEIERRTISWIAELIGYPSDCGGLFLGGGAVANFTALLTALKNTADYNITEEGLQSEHRKGKHTLYMSDHEGHVSILRSVDVINLGRSSIRRVPSNDDFTMNTNELVRMIDEDLASDNIPFCVVAQVGSINVGVADDLETIAKICSERNIWFHADGACGAVGAMLPELDHLYKGLDRADSVTLDPHKWLYIPYECGCLLVKDPGKLKKTFSITASYLQGTLPTDYKGLDYFDYGPQMSRGFNAAKVWMSLKHYGKEGYQKLLRQNILCAKHLHELVIRSEDFTAMHDPELFIYSFRFIPKELTQKTDEPKVKAALDRMNQRITDEIVSSGFAFIMTTKIRGEVVIRLSICSHRTTLKDIEQVFEKLRQIGDLVYAQERDIIFS
ncbi:MAG: aspartate aminotransferase family protein [Ignavibacteria bacterium]|nr:aspartate aminotransferase family protein [Ignavibacteria bacterium]